MNTKGVVIGLVGLIVVVGGFAFYVHRLGSKAVPTPAAAALSQSAVPAPSSASASSSTPLMQSTGMLFSEYKYFSKAYEVFPTVATGTKAAMGAFGYTKEDLGNNVYRFTLTNNAEGYAGQSVVAGPGQSVYFIEPSTRDDSPSEDSATTDDSLVAVDMQGYMLK